MKLNYKLFSLLLLGFVACKEQAKPAENTSIVAKPVDPTWSFKTEIDSLDNPRTQVFVVLKDTLKVDDAIGNFRILGKEEYSDRKLPKEALTACWGFWAGLEQQYILIDSSNTWVVKRKFIDEGSDGKEVFETVISAKK